MLKPDIIQVATFIHSLNKEGIVVSLAGDKIRVVTPKGQRLPESRAHAIREMSDLLKTYFKEHPVYGNIQQEPLAIRKRNETDIIPLSCQQEKIWVIHTLYGSVAYHLPQILHLKGNTHIEALEWSLREVVQRHEILRTVIEEKDGEVFQKIRPAANWQVEHLQIEDNLDNGLPVMFESLINRPFDLQRDTALRAALVHVTAQEYYLVIVLHHIAADGWSVGLLVKEFMQLYRSKVTGNLLNIDTADVQYADFAIWQRQQFITERFKKQLLYWEEKLRDVPVLYFPLDFPRPAMQSMRGNIINTVLDKTLIQQLKTLSQDQGVTLFTTLLTIFKILLYRYTGQVDITIGTPVAGRTQSVMESMMGFFANILVLHSNLSGNPAFDTLLKNIKQTTLDAYANQDVPFEKVVEKVLVERDLSRNPFFQIVFALQHEDILSGLTDHLDVSSVSVQHTTSKFDITFLLTEKDTGIECKLEYCTALFTAASMQQLLQHYKVLLAAFVADPLQRIDEVVLLTEQEQQQMLFSFNNETASYSTDKTILDLFVNQVIKTPDAVAVSFLDQQITYQALNNKANQLAFALRKKGIREETLVPVCMQRSIEMIIALLAILKAGGAYVPVDPEYPAARINYIIEDTGCSVVVCDRAAEVLLVTDKNIDIVVFDDTTCNMFESYPVANPANKLLPGNIAYVIYTSGSTGKPKGVKIEHRNVVRLFETDKPLFDFTSSDVWTMFHSFCFDFSVWEMYGALFYGGRLVVVSKAITRDAVQFAGLLAAEGVTVLNQTPGSFYTLQEVCCADDINLLVRYVVFGGEALNPSRLQVWKQQFPQCRLINMYGITETTVHVTYQEITGEHINSSSSIIGRAIPTLVCHVVNAAMQLQPIGVSGELYVGGAGVARSYLNREALTAERFVQHRFNGSTIDRYYKTGDLARWRPDGQLEYLGRIDDQVKIRGYRIELHEVETALLQVIGISQCVVVAKADRDGHQRLVAYVVAAMPEASKAAILMHCKSVLPDYMIPAQLVLVDKLLMTSNGKVDKKNLPDPDFITPVVKSFTAPRNTTEQEILDVWQQSLQTGTIDIHDNFFYAGGDSIKAIRVVGKLNQRFSPAITVLDLYQHNTIENLAAFLTVRQNGSQNSIAAMQTARHALHTIKKEVFEQWDNTQQMPEDVYSMSDIQKGMVFVSLLQPDSSIYHDQFVFRLTLPGFKPVLFHKAFKLLTVKHPILRTCYNLSGFNEELQLVFQDVAVDMPYDTMAGETPEKQEQLIGEYLQQERRRPFDVQKTVLWRWQIYDLGFTKHAFIFQCHHSILDGWSVASLLKELYELYSKLEQDENVLPLPISITPKDAILYSKCEKADEENILFWKQEMAGYKRLQLFSKIPFHRRFIKKYPAELLDALTEKATTANISIKTLFFGAYLCALNMYSSENELTVGLVTNHRPPLEDGDQLLGCFLNTIPVRFSVQQLNELSVIQYLEKLEAQLTALKRRESISLFEINRLLEDSVSAENPFFDTLFNFINFHVLGSLREDIAAFNNEATTLADEESHSYDITNTFLNLTTDITGGQLRFRYVQTRELEQGITLEKLHDYMMRFLQRFMEDADTSLSKEILLAPGEMQQLLDVFGRSEIHYPAQQTIVSTFRQQAERVPDHIALVYENYELTYRELDQQSNQLAYYLHSKGIRRDDLVVISVKRSIECIIGILGILKAGAAFVPVDTNNPADRVAYILNDTKARIFIGEASLDERLRSITNFISITRDQSLISAMPSIAVAVTVLPKQLAYIIYTSGSTGNPKGVMIEHQSLTDHIQGMIAAAAWEQCRSFALLASLSADAGHSVLFSALSLGCTIHMVSEAVLTNAKALRNYLDIKAIDCIKIVPSLWMSYAEDNSCLLPRRTIIFGGETFVPGIIELLKSAGYPGKVFNHYGPTETTIGKLIYKVDFSAIIYPVPIGRPFANTRLYVVDSNGEICCVGSIGELWIGGNGIARGYLNMESLTREKFVKDPFDCSDTAMIYKTGDYVRWLPDGNMQYLGRKDDQVKIRGNRIELGEIERVLGQCAFVAQCVVLAKPGGNGDVRLIAYIVSKNEWNQEAILYYLQSKLPDFMVPSLLINIPNIPLTTIGKINKKALPDPLTMDMLKIYEAPETELEKELAAIWQSYLKVKRIGRFDNFFELGGHSLLAVRIVGLIRERYSLNIPVTVLFKYPTIERLGAYLSAITTDDEAVSENSTQVLIL